jgi:septal ring factor EnvC (AmiA/AmiB activator)
LSKLRTTVVTALILATLLVAGSSQAAKLTERSKQKRAAEDARSEAQKKLADLRRDIDRTETAKGQAADALAASEAAISSANRSLHDLAQEQSDTEARLAKLATEQAELARTIAHQQEQLAILLRDQQKAGGEDRIKLLLSGDNPNRINRDLQYLGYVSQAQARLLESLRANMRAVEAIQTDTQNAKDDLDEIAEEAKMQKQLLEKEKARRNTLLTQLSGKLAAQRKDAGTIERDEQRLGSLVEKLAKLIEEQQKAEAAEREKQRKLAEARKLQEQKDRELRAAQAKNAPASKSQAGTSRPPKPQIDEAPTKSFAKNELTPVPGIQDGMFASLRGKLHLPLKGDLIARFGGKRTEGPPWKGLLIRANEGTEVKAIAAGRVVHAGYMRGLGNLIIIDHGGQYWTIYGSNQAILKHIDDMVKTGDVIALVGNTGGNEQSGLYFEMRYQGRVFDPLDWVTLK